MNTFVILGAAVACMALLALLVAYFLDKRSHSLAGAAATPAARTVVASAGYRVGARSLRFVWIALVLLVLAAAFYFRKSGAPQPANPETPFVTGAAPHGELSDLAGMAERLKQRLDAAGKDDSTGWLLLARTYVELKRYPEAVTAFARAHESLGDGDAQTLADYADALAMANGRRFNAKSKDLVARALKADPGNQKALELDASIAYDAGEYRRAAALWEKLLPLLPAGSDHARIIAANIAEARTHAGVAVFPATGR